MIKAGNELLAVMYEAGHITEEQFATIEREATASGQTPDAVLQSSRLVDEELLVKGRATLLNVPYVDLVGREFDPNVLQLISKPVAENAQSIAFAREGNSVSIAMVDPREMTAVQSLEFLAQASGFRPKYFIMSPASLRYVLKKYTEIGKEVASALEVAKEKLVEKPRETEEDGGTVNLEEIIKGAPVSRIVSVIMRHAVEGGASDIHIEPYGDETRIRYRVDGVLRTTLRVPKYVHNSLVSRIKVLANLKLDETRVPQDGRIQETFGDKRIDFRVSTLPMTNDEKIVMRILDTSKGVPLLEQLGFRQQFIEIIQQEILKPHGMFLISGPTGSGKSTTLFTVLNMRNDDKVNISTLEDPVEYQIKGVNQSQVRAEVGFTFAAGLRALLRQDPNIIMVGEIRDTETGELAVHAALTGHLIFSTVHTNDALGVVPRLIDMKVEPFLLSATMNIAIAQRLARKICERCRMEEELPPAVEAKMRQELASVPEKYKAHLDLTPPKLKVYRGRGCLRCNDTGYSGRVAVAEVMPFGERLRGLIAQGFPIEEVKKAVRESGLISLREDGLLKVLEGKTTMEEIMRITKE